MATSYGNENPNKPLEPLVLRKRIVEELERPGLVKYMSQIRLEQTKRPVLKRRPTVITWNHQEDDPPEFGLKPPEGSVTLYWAPAKSRIIRQLEFAHCSRNIERLEQLHKQLLVEYSQRSVITVEEAASNLLGAPSFFDFQYGCTLLAGNLYLHNAECGSITLPYNGGYFDPGEFETLEFSKDISRSYYDTLVIVSLPKLSEIERAAANAVPAHQASNNFAAADLCFSACALVTIAVFVTINTAVTGCCSPLHDRLAKVRLTEEMLERMGAITSARQLLAMRQEIFTEFGIL